MSQFLRLSEHPLSQRWVSQFKTSYDRTRASQLLNQLKLVSAREFETGIEQILITLQKRVDATLAVYPIMPPIPDEIIGYDPFIGAMPKHLDSQSREIGRRRKYGSEDRVGHLLTKLQEQLRGTSSASRIESAPTITQLNSQGIRHVVLVDDICSSGKRIASYWKLVHRRIKSLLSLKRCELWIVLFAITPMGRQLLKKKLPNFPIDTHLLTVLPETDLHVLPSELLNLCESYADILELWEVAIGYNESACPVVFEHGCPNGLPAILWMNCNGWTGLFPNRSIPTEMRPYFDGDGSERAIEQLWRANQPKLAMSILDALDQTVPLNPDDWMLLTFLGLRLRGIAESKLAGRVMMTTANCLILLDRASKMGMYNRSSGKVTALGKEFVARFRSSHKGERRVFLDCPRPTDLLSSTM